MSYDNLYIRGYVITDIHLDSIDSPYINDIKNRWIGDTIGSYNIFRHPRLQYTKINGSYSYFALLGDVIDPMNDIIVPSDILNRLAIKYERSMEQFFDYLDVLNGRFVLFVHAKGQSFIVQDAAGTKTVFYEIESDRVVVASHANIIAEMFDYSFDRETRVFINSDGYRKRSIKYLPGLLTPYQKVRTLTPNTLLNLGTKRVERFFPRTPLTQTYTPEDVVECIAPVLKEQAELLLKKYKIALSLTAGLDSRTSLSVFRKNKRDVTCFTYQKPKSFFSGKNQQDIRIAQLLCRKYGLNHIVTGYSNKYMNGNGESFLSIWKRNSMYIRPEINGIRASILSKYFDNTFIHLKSNISEITRADYRRTIVGQAGLTDDIHAYNLAQVYNINPASAYVRNAFADYITITQFNSDTTYNYDPYDLFCWEHQTGVWQSLQIMDYDIAFDAFLLFNNRWVLTQMLGTPLECRMNDRIHYLLISKLWPELLTIPTNPPLLKDRLLSGMAKAKSSLLKIQD